jgi:hypothetical protein
LYIANPADPGRAALNPFFFSANTASCEKKQNWLPWVKGRKRSAPQECAIEQLAQTIKQRSKHNEDTDTSIPEGISPWAVVDNHRYCVGVRRQRALLLE